MSRIIIVCLVLFFIIILRFIHVVHTNSLFLFILDSNFSLQTFHNLLIHLFSKYFFSCVPQFLMVMFLFLFSSYYFLIDSLACWLFRSILFHFQLFEDSRYLSVTDLKFHFLVIKQHILYELNPFKFTEACFMAHIWFILVNILCELEKDVHSTVVK